MTHPGLTLRGGQLTHAILSGAKKIENRHFRLTPGWYALHTGASTSSHESQRPLLAALPDMPAEADLPHSAIIVGAIRVSHHLFPHECSGDQWAFGPVCNVINAVCRLERPVYHKGALSLWNISSSSIGEVRAQLERAEVEELDVAHLPGKETSPATAACATGGGPGGTGGGTGGGMDGGTGDRTHQLLDQWLPKSMLVDMVVDEELTKKAPIISGWDSPRAWFRGDMLTMGQARALFARQPDSPPHLFIRKLSGWEAGVPHLLAAPSHDEVWYKEANLALYQTFQRGSREHRCQFLDTLTFEQPGHAFVAVGAAELEQSLRSHLPSQPIGFTFTMPGTQDRHQRWNSVMFKAVSKYDNVTPGHQLSNERRMWRVEMRGKAPLYSRKVTSDLLQRHLPGFSSVMGSVQDMVGDDATLLYIDILDGAVSFECHQDTEEERGQQITVVVKLSQGHSSVCIGGSKEISALVGLLHSPLGHGTALECPHATN